MKNTPLLLLLFVNLITPAITSAGGMNDDPMLATLMVDQLEIRSDNDSSLFAWDVEGWAGKDLNKFWVKTDGEYDDGRVGDAELQALYSRAIAPFWDMQVGWRRDIRPSPDRDWLAIGLRGLAPYYFDVDVAVFVGDSGRSAARLQLEYEIMFTQRLVFTPELELNLYGKDDQDTGIGSGLSNIEAGLRLRYEFCREFAPYIGLNWSHLYGQTADFSRAAGEDTNDFRFVFGIRAWL